MKKIIKLIKLIPLLILVLILEIALLPPLTTSTSSQGSYENIIGDNVSKYTTPVTEIAMLGAHDAFTYKIGYDSGSNVNESGIHNNKIVNKLAKGFVIKLSKAQVDSAKTMLYHGVRYFDVRITKIDNTYYTTHGLLSSPLEEYVKDIVEFLNSHPKEFVIFDIQEFYTSNGSDSSLPEEDFDELFEYLNTLGLMDKLNYSTSLLGPWSISYGDITNYGTKGGCIMLAKTSSNLRVFNRDGNADKDTSKTYSSIRSYWHNTNSIDELTKGIEEEYNFINDNNGYKNVFRVNQAQMTGFIVDASSIYRTITHNSLIGLAKSSNKVLVSSKDTFIKYLSAMPIVMVDYATSSRGDFNTKANSYIAEYNQNYNK